jgi:dGTPase
VSLAPYACDPAASRGRLHREGDAPPGPRDAFQRDRDRIIHSIAFRRLRQKTQVFVAPDDDHVRVRLTHSLEVAQIGRAIARSLGLNEDLTEALCLAHDIGHAPFGHAGEDALDAAMREVGGFDHNAHTLRALTLLETPYPRFPGLNLSWEVLEGLAKHNGPVADPPWALAEVDDAFPLDLATMPSLEAQVAALADDIAYDNHDIDDGLRAGLFMLDEVLAVPFVAESWQVVRRRFPEIEPARLIGELVREQIGRMVNGLLAETRARVAGLTSVAAVRGADRPVAAMPDAMLAGQQELKRFLGDHMYFHPAVLALGEDAAATISSLYAGYRDHPLLLPAEWRYGGSDPVAAGRRIGDFIAGMTDRFARRAALAVSGHGATATKEG